MYVYSPPPLAQKPTSMQPPICRHTQSRSQRVQSPLHDTQHPIVLQWAFVLWQSSFTLPTVLACASTGIHSCFDGPQSRLESPRLCFNDPRSWFNGPRSSFDIPCSCFDGPRSCFNGHHLRFDSPRSCFDGPCLCFDGCRSCFESSTILAHNSMGLTHASTVLTRHFISRVTQDKVWSIPCCGRVYLLLVPTNQGLIIPTQSTTTA